MTDDDLDAFEFKWGCGGTHYASGNEVEVLIAEIRRLRRGLRGLADSPYESPEANAFYAKELLNDSKVEP